MKNKHLKKRIIEIAYKNKLSHIGSCLTAVDIIDEIYSLKKPDEKFVLSSGHAGLALYVVLEEYNDTINAEEIWNHHGTHPDRCNVCRIDCSSGSLGHGLPIAVGMALADRSKDVYCLISDGELAEGSMWEALRIQDQLNLENLKIFINWNGWGAYGEPAEILLKWLSDLPSYLEYRQTSVEQFPFLKGQDAHYHVMNEEEYKLALEVLG